MLYPRTKAAHYLPNPRDLLELIVKLINLLQYGMKASDLGIRHLYCIPSAIVLGLSGNLCGLIELRRVSVQYGRLHLNPVPAPAVDQ